MLDSYDTRILCKKICSPKSITLILMILEYLVKRYVVLRALNFLLNYCLSWMLNYIKSMVVLFSIDIMSVCYHFLSHIELHPTILLNWTTILDLVTNTIEANWSETSYSLWTDLVGRKSGLLNVI